MLISMMDLYADSPRKFHNESIRGDLVTIPVKITHEIPCNVHNESIRNGNTTTRVDSYIYTRNSLL